MSAGAIRVGIGGWTFPPWRDNFYPAKLVQSRELEFASRAVTAIEINGTFHSLQKPASFAKWAAAVPDEFVFAVKGSRYVTTRRALADAGEAVGRFVDQGLVELGDKLGPILWQLPHTKRFDPDDLRAFLALLPTSHGGLTLRHAIQSRHESFVCPAFVELARAAGVATVFADSAKYPGVHAITADFVYARLEQARADEPDGLGPAELDRWTAAARAWAAGGWPDDLPLLGDAPPKVPRETFVFAINGAKERAPALAQALRRRLG